jgi:four helix bundle protein
MHLKIKDTVIIQSGVYLKESIIGEVIYLQVKNFDENGMLLSHLPSIVLNDKTKKCLLSENDSNPNIARYVDTFEEEIEIDTVAVQQEIDCKQKKEFVLSMQILRSRTCVGTMAREAEHAETKIDFKHKMAITQNEINETIYWLKLLKVTECMIDGQFGSINADAVEIIKPITTIIKSAKSTLSIIN